MFLNLKHLCEFVNSLVMLCLFVCFVDLTNSGKPEFHFPRYAGGEQQFMGKTFPIFSLQNHCSNAVGDKLYFKSANKKKQQKGKY